MVNSARENHKIAEEAKEFERTYVYNKILGLIDKDAFVGKFYMFIEPRYYVAPNVALGKAEHDDMFKCLKNTPEFVKDLEHMGYLVEFIKPQPDSNYEYIKISW